LDGLGSLAKLKLQYIYSTSTVFHSCVFLSVKTENWGENLPPKGSVCGGPRREEKKGKGKGEKEKEKGRGKMKN
jgi:hypothetical protein